MAQRQPMRRMCLGRPHGVARQRLAVAGVSSPRPRCRRADDVLLEGAGCPAEDGGDVVGGPGNQLPRSLATGYSPTGESSVVIVIT
jgi:hypothetical protein